MRGDAQKMFAVLVIALISSVILAVIFWPQIQKWESVRFAACSPCGDETVKIEALNYLTTLVADQNVFEGVRIRLCNCRADKADLSVGRIRYTVELPDGAVKCSNSYPLPKNKAGGQMVPRLEPQEGAKFDWYEMAPAADIVLISRPNCDPTQTPNLEASDSGRVTLELLNATGEAESGFVWQVFYAPICPGTCKSKFGGYYCQPWEAELGVLNCETDERCCK